MPEPRPIRPIATILAIALGCAAYGSIALGGGEEERAAPRRPTELRDEGYVGSEACGECHPRNAETWHASYHRTMTQVATPAAIRAPFEGTTPLFDGTVWKLSREGDRSFVAPLSEKGESLGARREIVLTTGSHHYQIYWLEARDGEDMATLPLIWHLGERRWVPRKAMFLIPPTTEDMVEAGRWSKTCIKCHATNGTPRHPADERTHVAQFGIACEACHGPGARHVELERARERDAAAGAVEPDLARETAIVGPADLTHDRASQVCGQCHGVHLLPREAIPAWEREGFAYRPGDDLAATKDLLRGTYERNSPAMRAFLDRNPGTLESLFWSDGEVRVSGREYNGLVESPCFQRGELGCLSCHDLHPSREDRRPLEAWAEDQLLPGRDGPRACIGCHAEYGEPERVRAHTHHAPGGPGTNCLDCHMPYTSYGLTKALRSHTITSPSAAASLATGRPSACNQCHLDKSLGWTADRLHEWYGAERPALDRDREEVAASVLWALEGDAGLRALAAWNLGWEPARATSGTGWIAYLLSTLLQDPYDAVRWIAWRTLRKDPRYAGFDLDFTRDPAEQRALVRAGVLTDWTREGLRASAEQRAAVLVRPDGTLDVERFRAIRERIDRREFRLAE